MSDEKIKGRISKVWSKYGIFRKELNDHSVPIKLRMKLFDAVISPTILYGSEAWAMTKRRQVMLRSTQRKMLRLMIQAHRTYDYFDDHVSWIKDATKRAETAMAEHGVKSWTESQCARSWAWAGKVAQSHEGRWTYTAAKWQPHTRRSRGRPKARWHDPINQYLTSTTSIEHQGDDWIKVASSASTWALQRDSYIAHADLALREYEDQCDDRAGEEEQVDRKI